ncbi:MAG: hypothetical protein FGO69_09445 [Methanobacterium sp.]|nr:MAG: hypothetical protein FGO69_09445 [Methanobacterium sp.]
MDMHEVFRGISSQLTSEFERITTQITHPGSIGTSRERIVQDFLSKGKLPKKYAIGKGEIIGPDSNVSKQSDLIIYDDMNAVPLLYNEDTQIYPVESVCGVIEVKSKLSKTKLVEGLENIKSVKEVAPNDYVTYESLKRSDIMVASSFKRPVPFGIIFAFDLDDNSLDSLMNNLNDWEQDKDSRYWPNLIVVLNKGIIYHQNSDRQKMLTDDEITEDVSPGYTAYEEDTLLHFYSILLDLCRSIPIMPFNLLPYLDLPIEIGEFNVKTQLHYYPIDTDEVDPNYNRPFTYSESFIEEVLTYCKEVGKITDEEALIKQLGTTNGINPDRLNSEVYLYNPEDLPGLHEVDGDFNKPSIAGSTTILIDNESYIIPHQYITRDKLEELVGRRFIYQGGSIQN